MKRQQVLNYWNFVVHVLFIVADIKTTNQSKASKKGDELTYPSNICHSVYLCSDLYFLFSPRNIV